MPLRPRGPEGPGPRMARVGLGATFGMVAGTAMEMREEEAGHGMPGAPGMPPSPF